MTIFAVKGEAGPDLAMYYNSSTGSSVTLAHDLNEANACLYAHAYKSYSQSSLATSLVELAQLDTEDPDDGTSDTHGWWDGSLLGRSSDFAASWSSISTPTNAAMHAQYDLATSSNNIDAGTWVQPAYFPHGGFIVLRTDTGISCDSMTSVVGNFNHRMVGTWELQANCNYVPE
jgi:hypothetical protein